MQTAIFGGGSWGTTLANLLARKNGSARLWVREKELASLIRTKGCNPWYLPELELSPNLFVSDDLAQVTENAEYFLFVVPSQFYGGVLKTVREHLPKKPVIISGSKGITLDTLQTMSEVTEDTLIGLKPVFAMLSGPSFAKEVSKGMPTAVTLGCKDKTAARAIQDLLSTDTFRVYTNKDVRGVELGGAFKNIIAIASGISDGLGFGTNARAALITRGLAEMSRLGVAMGAQAQTFMGLSGMGDLVLTCTGDLSRNRQVGLKLAEGHKLLDILGQMKMVAEGVKTTESVHALGSKHKVELPITEQVYQVLYEGKDPLTAVHELMHRELKSEQ
ncbi:glycerol-3-phosphate dehydrogenase (NAD(P)+) [Desulfonatronum thiosulfatophilum]|uniref:Glycerol-3-phosphate dehydrogenase [NAD(P)+] n=1 Tax=Desulfonatronum thiosulfatophilum TaxID=617002 RepID=A0A1G6BD15_9BACT|nr:NAD(P)H-dependent glycerol-3-phosphate dehydrogenase [Desulfonatronum thiosulfatophilum]SDB18521.1 glycerol-3-phosphate dehydrogenase (NAD(P)+) [Desulfonatronum thiosulfatophilum]